MKFQTENDGFRTAYSKFIFLCLPYGIDNFQLIRVAPSPNAKAQPNFIARNLWILVPIGSLERMGLLLFDRLALSGASGLRRNGYAVELYRISG